MTNKKDLLNTDRLAKLYELYNKVHYHHIKNGENKCHPDCKEIQKRISKSENYIFQNKNKKSFLKI